MKIILTFFLVLLCSHIFSQNVVIAEDESSADASAILDVQSTTKGFLFPRVALESLTSTDPVVNPAEGLFVFSAGGTIPNGIYYWNGSKWVSFLKEDSNPVPIGTILSFGGDISKIPDGWLLCDGTPYLRTAYPTLFSVIGESWGNGDGTNTFNVPDLRGYFLRGVDKTTITDIDAADRIALNGGNTGSNVGSYQQDELASHDHAPPAGLNAPWVGNDFTGDGEIDGSAIAGAGENSHTSGNVQHTGGSETRPKNAYVNYIIK